MRDRISKGGRKLWCGKRNAFRVVSYLLMIVVPVTFGNRNVPIKLLLCERNLLKLTPLRKTVRDL